jgi:hypothetical protein
MSRKAVGTLLGVQGSTVGEEVTVLGVRVEGKPNTVGL